MKKNAGRFIFELFCGLLATALAIWILSILPDLFDLFLKTGAALKR